MIKKIYIFVFLIFIISCEKPIVTEEAIKPTVISPKPVSISSFKDNDIDKLLLITLVNKLRKSGCKCGTETLPSVSEVKWNENLEKAAFYHSKDMNDKKYFSHTGLNGSDPGQRIKLQSYAWLSYGENIFMATGYTPSEQDVIDAWQNSPSHCKNIMYPKFAEMGVGEFNSHWTQVFGTK